MTGKLLHYVCFGFSLIFFASRVYAAGPLPTITTYSVSPASILPGESAVLTWCSDNTTAVYIDPLSPSPVAICGTATVSPAQTTTYTIKASNNKSTITKQVVLTVGEVLVRMTYPQDGSSVKLPITGLRGEVRGEVINPGGKELGIVVNGVTALVAGNQFVANRVPLEEGLNTIVAEATDFEGNKFQASSHVYGVAAANYVTLSSSTESGLSPLDVDFSADKILHNPVSSASLACSGPTNPEVKQINITSYSATLAEPGLYECTITITDNINNTYTGTAFVNVLSKEEMEAFFRSKWEGMTSELVNGHIENALKYFAGGQESKYKPGLEKNVSRFPSMFSADIGFNLVSIFDDTSECESLAIENEKVYSYPVMFVKDENGLWKIRQF